MQSRRSRAASERAGRATRSRTDPSALQPAVACDRNQLVQACLELLLARPLEALLQDLEDLRLRAAVDEDDEAEAELLLVDLVQIGELGQDGRMTAAALLGCRAGGQVACADRRMRVQGLEPLFLGELGDRLIGRPERVLPLGKQLDQPGTALEELGELVG